MSAMSRRKGKTGELEVAKILTAWGFQAKRDGRLDVDLVHNVEGVHFEVKRRETLALPQWMRQAAAEAGEKEPVVVFRQNGQPWKACVDFDFLASLLSARADLKNWTGGR